MTASRWRTAKNMSVSGSTTKFQPKPPPPQGGHRAKNNTSFKQGPKSMDTNTGPAIASQHRKIQAVPPPKPETSSNTVKAEHTSVPSIVREDTAHDGLRLLSTGGCSSGVHEALPRSGSAPSSSAMALINPLGTTFSSSCRPTVENPPLLGEGIKIGCPTSQPEGNVANTTRSCWDERRDSIVNPVDCATPPPRCGSASTTGNKAARSTVSDGQPTEPIPRQSGPSNSSTRNGGLKGQLVDSVWILADDGNACPMFHWWVFASRCGGTDSIVGSETASRPTTARTHFSLPMEFSPTCI